MPLARCAACARSTVAEVEGVYASIDSGVVDFMFVCDQDDPDAPSPLLVAQWDF